ncbi:MAG: hypothetical protein CMN02_14065, partial [Roseibacillus sp.]|nr:hypothetical protein [Roseibacillus sp.]
LGRAPACVIESPRKAIFSPFFTAISAIAVIATVSKAEVVNAIRDAVAFNGLLFFFILRGGDYFRSARVRTLEMCCYQA